MFCAIAERMIDEGLMDVSTKVLNPDLSYHIEPLGGPFPDSTVGVPEKVKELAVASSSG
jgi:hypothetical protein